MTRVLLFMLFAAGTSAHAERQSHEHMFFDQLSGTKLVIASQVALEDLKPRLEQTNINNVVQIWSGKGSRLYGEHVLETFAFESYADVTAMILQSGSVMLLDLATGDEGPMINLLPPTTAAVIFGSVTTRGSSMATLEGMLFGAGRLLSEVDLEGRNWRQYVSLEGDTSESLTFDDMLVCERELAERT